MISLDPWVCYFFALLTLVLPTDWLFAAVTAALVHEMFHVAAIYCVGGHVHHIWIRPGGMVLETDLDGNVPELLCAVAGPAGSLLLLSLCHVIPKIALCAGVQGLFNLLPVYPLDGGRMLRCILQLVCPSLEERIMQGLEFIICFIIAAAAIIRTFVYSLGSMPVYVAGFLLLRVIIRKIPCKRRQIGVQ